MKLSQEFISEVSKISNNKDALIDLMNQLDKEKRSIKSFMRQYSNEPKTGKGGSGPERYKKLRRIKDRQSFLIEEREYVRQKLGELKAKQKALNRAINSRSAGFSQAFIAAAERILQPDLFKEIETEAFLMLEIADKKRNDP